MYLGKNSYPLFYLLHTPIKGGEGNTRNTRSAEVSRSVWHSPTHTPFSAVVVASPTGGRLRDPRLLLGSGSARPTTSHPGLPPTPPLRYWWRHQRSLACFELRNTCGPGDATG